MTTVDQPDYDSVLNRFSAPAIESALQALAFETLDLSCQMLPMETH